MCITSSGCGPIPPRIPNHRLDEDGGFSSFLSRKCDAGVKGGDVEHSISKARVVAAAGLERIWAISRNVFLEDALVAAREMGFSQSYFPVLVATRA